MSCRNATGVVERWPGRLWEPQRVSRVNPKEQRIGILVGAVSDRFIDKVDWGRHGELAGLHEEYGKALEFVLLVGKLGKVGHGAGEVIETRGV